METVVILVCLDRLGLQRLDNREDNLLCVLVELDHFQRKVIPHAEVSGDALDRSKGKLRGRHETIHAMRKLYNNTLIGDTDDFPFGILSNTIFVDELIPRVQRHLLMSKRDTALCGINAKDHHFEILSLLDHLPRMAKFLRPTEIADMDKAINTRLQLDEDAEVREVADNAGMT